ncbi:MAG: molybdopterin molybdotransferase MoeA [Flavobacteriales bacterium]|nr:molybdopterin molybdotransferase MoeA [Flavobacteriales bacterium]
MISVNEAIKIIDANDRTLSAKTISTCEALGYTLAKDIHSNLNFPPFNQSAMDGYALNYQEGLTKYLIKGEAKAGDKSLNLKINPGEGVRIFTGAKIPDSCSTVIQQEWCKQDNDEIIFTNDPKDNLNFRKTGEQIKKGEVALRKGTEISPALIGYLIGLGEHKIQVINKPTIGIVITGSELLEPGESLEDGKIYESNSFMLIAALRKYHYPTINVYKTKDNFEQTKNTIESAIAKNYVILISGGISVGEYDFVEKSLKELNVKKKFYKVKQKPGKPLFYGTHNQKHIFGLPGNPGAVLTCYYIYVLRLLSIVSGKKYPLEKTMVSIDKGYLKKSGRSEFLKVEINKGIARVCNYQNSSMLRAFEKANALIYISEEIEEINSSETIEAYLLL